MYSYMSYEEMNEKTNEIMQSVAAKLQATYRSHPISYSDSLQKVHLLVSIALGRSLLLSTVQPLLCIPFWPTHSCRQNMNNDWIHMSETLMVTAC